MIKIDISRTFPETEKFDDSHQNKLLRILSAYSNFNLDVGYCQGMNFIAGLLLLVSGSNEEETFWMFVQLMELRGLKGFYKDKFPMLRYLLVLVPCCTLNKSIYQSFRTFTYENHGQIVTPTLNLILAVVSRF